MGFAPRFQQNRPLHETWRPPVEHRSSLRTGRSRPIGDKSIAEVAGGATPRPAERVDGGLASLAAAAPAQDQVPWRSPRDGCNRAGACPCVVGGTGRGEGDARCRAEARRVQAVEKTSKPSTSVVPEARRPALRCHHQSCGGRVCVPRPVIWGVVVRLTRERCGEVSMATRVGQLCGRRASRWHQPPELRGLVLPIAGVGRDVPTQASLRTWRRSVGP